DYHFPMPWVDIAASIYLPKKTKLVVHWHSEIVKQKKAAKVLSVFIHRCLQRATKIVVADKIYLENSPTLSHYRNKCVVIPLGIAPTDWQTVNSDEKAKIIAYKQQYKVLILAVGRLTSYKGFNVLISAMQYIDGDLILVGQGRLDAELKNLA